MIVFSSSSLQYYVLVGQTSDKKLSCRRETVRASH